MNFKSILLLTSLLYNHISSEELAEKNVSKNENQVEIRSENDKIKFIDLCDDVQFLIFERLDFIDLMNLIDAIPQTYSLAIEFISKYEILISDVFQAGIPKFYCNAHRKRIEIHNIDLLCDVLKRFGDSIHKIEDLTHYGDPDQLAIISRSINEYGQDSLTCLELGEIKKNAFEQFTVPFKRLEDLTFTVRAKQFRNGSLPVNKLFPNLRRLNIISKSNEKIDFSYIVGHFPLLQELHMKGLTNLNTLEQRKQMDEFIRENPQIRTIEVESSPDDYTKFLAETLPNLESLKLDNFNVWGDDVQIESVKHFNLNFFSPNAIDKLTFSHLESLEIKYSVQLFKSWLEFFKNHHDLSRLHVEVFHNERDVRLDELMNEMPNLVEISFNCLRCVNTEMVTQIIKNHKNLMKFKFLTLMPQDDLSILRKRFDYDWDIYDVKSCWNGLLFERKM